MVSQYNNNNAAKSFDILVIGLNVYTYIITPMIQ